MNLYTNYRCVAKIVNKTNNDVVRILLLFVDCSPLAVIRIRKKKVEIFNLTFNKFH